MEPRKPTQEEKEQLVEYMWIESYVAPTQEEKEQQREFVEGAAIAVFDSYMPDSPGYVGKVMVVIWPGGVSLVEVFIWEDGKIVRETIDTGVPTEA